MLYSKSSHTESGQKAIALFFMALLFFVYAAEAMHYHNDAHRLSQAEYSLTAYSPQCLICDQLQHQHHDLIWPGLIQVPESPIYTGIEINFFYSFTFYPLVKLTIQNKDPPFNTPFYSFY